MTKVKVIWPLAGILSDQKQPSHHKTSDNFSNFDQIKLTLNGVDRNILHKLLNVSFSPPAKNVLKGLMHLVSLFI